MSSNFEIILRYKKDKDIQINLFYLSTTPARELFDELPWTRTQVEYKTFSKEKFKELLNYYQEAINREQKDFIKLTEKKEVVKETIKAAINKDVFIKASEEYDELNGYLQDYEKNIEENKDMIITLTKVCGIYFEDEQTQKNWNLEYYGG